MSGPQRPLRFLSLFSGIEAASVAWNPLGWECVAVAEIEPFPCSVLAHHYPEVPNLGDVTKITEDQIKQLGHIDVVVGGFPCQDVSVAGKRKGLTNADGTSTRSGLFFTGFQIFLWAKQHCDARFLLIENVPGLYSSHKGRDFAAVVGHMAGLDEVRVPAQGWGAEGVAVGDNGLLEWCTLDAQWFGLAQRRKRVFALLDTGNWPGRPPILLEPQSLRGDSPPSREPGQRPAPTLNARTQGGGGLGTDFDCDGGLITSEVAACLDASFARLQGASGQDLRHGHSHLVAFGGNNTSGPIDVATAINAHGGPHGRLDFESETFVTQAFPDAIAFSCKDYGADAGEISPTLRAMGHDGSHANAGGQVAVASQATVRRITPTEAERLQGNEDGYTRIPVKHLKQKPRTKHFAKYPDHYGQDEDGSWTRYAADGPRYKSLGNSFAVAVIRWIGLRTERALGLAA